MAIHDLLVEELRNPDRCLVTQGRRVTPLGEAVKACHDVVVA